MFIVERKLIEGELDAIVEKVSEELTNFFILPFSIIMIVGMIVVSYVLKEVANYITQPIIDLYHEIKVIINHHLAEQQSKTHHVRRELGLIEKNAKKFVANRRKTQEFNLMLNYSPRNQEMNQLYLAFSKLTKTIKFARMSMALGDSNTALLKYHEVADIFRELQNFEQLGSCINNLGCIYLKKKQYKNSKIFL